MFSHHPTQSRVKRARPATEAISIRITHLLHFILDFALLKEDYGDKIMKIAIIGNCGSGKSTLGLMLHKKLHIPLYHIDQYFWKSGWKRTDPIECAIQYAKHIAIIAHIIFLNHDKNSRVILMRVKLTTIHLHAIHRPRE
jgi:hypothetical protein